MSVEQDKEIATILPIEECPFCEAPGDGNELIWDDTFEEYNAKCSNCHNTYCVELPEYSERNDDAWRGINALLPNVYRIDITASTEKVTVRIYETSHLFQKGTGTTLAAAFTNAVLERIDEGRWCPRCMGFLIDPNPELGEVCGTCHAKVEIKSGWRVKPSLNMAVQASRAFESSK